MTRVLSVVLVLLLIGCWPAVAGPADYGFDAYRTPGFVLFVPQGEAIDGLGPHVEALYASVSDIWLPDLAVCGDIASCDQSAVLLPELDGDVRYTFTEWNPELALRMPGSCVPVPCTVIAYRTATDLAWDYCAFDRAGCYYDETDIMLYGELEAAMQRVVARLAHPVDLPHTRSFVCVSGYTAGRWESALAHEFTHLLQYTTGLMWRDEESVSVRLLFEGMATLTEFRLGLRERFVETILWPAAHWIQLGGQPADVPYYILYELGTALVHDVCDRFGEATFWRIFSPLGFGVDLGCYELDLTDEEVAAVEAGFEEAVGGDVEAYEDMPFADRFRLNTGEEWFSFLDHWIAEMNAVRVTEAGVAVFEWLRRSVSLRRALLRPVLDADTLDRLGELAELLSCGGGRLADVDEAERLLNTAPSDIDRDTVDELSWRVPTLTRAIRRIGGPTDLVYGLSNLLIHADDDPEAYVRAYVDIVNRHTTWPLPAAPPLDG